MSNGATSTASAARSWLFVPGTRPERFTKAETSGTDLVIIDLEDAVPAGEKATAREATASWLSGDGVAAVRVNPAGSEHHIDDVAALADLPGLRAVLLPMSESPGALSELHRRFGDNVPLVAQVETALGLLRAFDLAAAPGVVRLAFGHLDFAGDIDAALEPEPLLHARSSLVVASRAARVAGPIDSITTDLDDEQATRADATRARSLGFTGKLCIHPTQVAAVNQAMSPTAGEVAWAERVLAAGITGATRVDGQMVDAPVVARAQQVMTRAERAR